MPPMTQEPVLPKSDPPLRVARIQGARLTYTDEGDPARPVFFAIHGIPGSVKDFRYLAPPLETIARLIRVDLPGSGGSEPRLPALRSMEIRGRTILELADSLGISRFGLIGHSMGAGTALVTGSMAPERVDRLVLIAPMGLRRHRGLPQSNAAFRVLAAALRVPGLRNLLMPALRKQYRRSRFPRGDEMTPAEYAIQFEGFSAADFNLMKRAVRRPLPSKTLIALADDDHLVQPEIPLELAAAIPGAVTLRFADGGHIIQKNKAAEIAEAIHAL
jgi:pimeloyl-ACP methyl ester carboxylesterase